MKTASQLITELTQAGVSLDIRSHEGGLRFTGSHKTAETRFAVQVNIPAYQLPNWPDPVAAGLEKLHRQCYVQAAQAASVITLRT